MKIPIRPIIQALEFHISAVLVNPRKGASNFGSTFGNSTPGGSFAAWTLKETFFFGWEIVLHGLRWLNRDSCWLRRDTIGALLGRTDKAEIGDEVAILFCNPNHYFPHHLICFLATPSLLAKGKWSFFFSSFFIFYFWYLLTMASQVVSGASTVDGPRIK